MKDYQNTPQRLKVYESSDKAKEIMKKSISMDTLWGGNIPNCWAPGIPNFHETMDRMKAAGFSVLGVGTTSDGEGSGAAAALHAVSFYYKMLNERPDAYLICRTAADIDRAIKEDKLGWYFVHQGTDHYEGDPDKVALFRHLGYGYCLLSYNRRTPYGDGIFEPDDGNLTIMGKLLIEAYNKYGMLVDVSHVGNRSALGAIEHSTQPVISSHSVAKAIADYPRSLSDEVMKGVAASGGVCSINTVGAFVDLSNPDIVTTDMVFRHVDYMAELIGIDHVGFGSDWMPYVNWVANSVQEPIGAIVFPDNGYTAAMGAKGVPTPDPSDFLPALLDTMLEHGYSEEDCGKFVGGNSYRVYKEVWKEY